MKIKDAGFSTQGSATLPPSPHITPDTLMQDLNQFFGPRGYETALLGPHVVLKKSSWAWVSISILQEPQSTTLRFGPALSQSLRLSVGVIAALGGLGLAVLRVIGVLQPTGALGWIGEMGMIPFTLIGVAAGMILFLIIWSIVYPNAGKPLLAEFRSYLEQSPLLHNESSTPEKDAQKAARRKAKRAAKKKADEDEDGGAS